MSMLKHIRAPWSTRSRWNPPLTPALLAALSIGPNVVSVTHAAADEGTQIEEVVVTSRRREENLQDVPVSVQAFTASNLQMRSLDSLTAVGQNTPNLTFGEQAQSGSSASVVYIRGVGQADTLAAFDPGVGIYVDGVYLGRMTANDLDMMDIERIEVLRGPQGTLFGKNTNGGAISIVNKKPDVSADGVSGRFEVTGGSRNRRDAVANANIPLSRDVAALQVAVARRSQDGYSTRVDGEQQADKDRWNGRIALLLKPSEDFEVLWNADVSSFNQGSSAYRLVAVREDSVVPTIYAAFTNARYDNRWVSNSDYFSNGTGPNVNDGKLWGTSLTLTWDREWATVKSITSYRHSDIDSQIDPDGSPNTVLDVLESVRQHQFSQELQLTGEAFDDRLKWVTGLYYFNESALDKNDFNVALEFFGGAANFNQYLDIENISYALYSQGTYELTDKLNLTVGARGTYESKQVKREQAGQQTVAPSGNWTSFLPRVGLDYRWSDELMTYVSAAQGNKSGGFNGRAASVAEFNRFDPEKVWTYEVGMRSDWLDRRVRLNATLFYSRYSDMQIQLNASVTDPVTGQPVPFTIVGNIPSTEIKGAEVELTVVPVAGLELGANAGLADGKYKRLIPGAPVTTDDEFLNTPKVSYTLSAQYAADIGSSTLTGRIDYSHKSLIEYDYGNSDLVDQPAYGLLNARLTLGVANTGLSFSLFGLNLTDEHYALAGHDDHQGGTLGFVLQQMGAPREWGLSAQYKF